MPRVLILYPSLAWACVRCGCARGRSGADERVRFALHFVRKDASSVGSRNDSLKAVQPRSAPSGVLSRLTTPTIATIQAPNPPVPHFIEYVVGPEIVLETRKCIVCPTREALIRNACT